MDGYSNLELIVMTSNKSQGFPYKNGDSLSLDIAIGHPMYGPEGSKADAYNAELFIFYDAQQLTLTKYGTVMQNPRSLPANQQVNRNGLVYFQTGRFPFLRNQRFNVSFEVNIATYIGKISRLEGVIIVEFIFNTNRREFGGRGRALPKRYVTYDCEVDENLDKRERNERLNVPNLSVLYNDVTNSIFFCVKKEIFSQRHVPRCYWTKDGDLAWTRIPYIASLIGIDAVDSTLYGIDPNGNGYAKLSRGYTTFSMVDDVIWTSIENEPRVRKAETSDSLGSLPSYPSGRWVFSAAGTEKWAATQNGLLQKTELGWERRVQF